MRQVRCLSVCFAVTNISMDQWQATNDRCSANPAPVTDGETLFYPPPVPACSLVRVGDFNWLNPPHPTSNQNLLIVSNCDQTPETQIHVLSRDTGSQLWRSLSHTKSRQQSLAARINSVPILWPADAVYLGSYRIWTLNFTLPCMCVSWQVRHAESLHKLICRTIFKMHSLHVNYKNQNLRNKS